MHKPWPDALCQHRPLLHERLVKFVPVLLRTARTGQGSSDVSTWEARGPCGLYLVSRQTSRVGVAERKKHRRPAAESAARSLEELE